MEFKKIIDVSRKIYAGTAVWPGDESFNIVRKASLENGDPCNVSSVNMGLHTGTHIDAPLHFIDGGANTALVELSRFIGFAKVFELNVSGSITAEDIKDLPIHKDDIVFFKTSNSLLPDESVFYTDFIYLEACAARFLVEKGVKTVGVDYLSIDRYNVSGSPAHMALLSSSTGVIEGLCLKNVLEGRYFFSCLPLRIEGGDGSPVRAVLIELEE